MRKEVFDYFCDDARTVREQVFIYEEHMENDFDDNDEQATHFVIFDGDTPVATCRAFPSGEQNTFVIGRIAVVKDHRSMGLGRMVVNFAEDYIKTLGGDNIALHAQCKSSKFCEKIGYTSYGEIDYEDDMPHIWMYKTI